MQIKGRDFIPPTNLLWLAAMGLRGEMQLWRKPESESLAPLSCQTLRRMDLLPLKDAQLPGFDCLLGGSAAEERAFGVGGVRLAEESGMVPCTRGGTGTGTRRQQRCLVGSAGVQEGCGKQGRVRARVKTRRCVLVCRPGEKGPRKGLRAAAAPTGRRGGGFSTKQ